MTIKKILMVGSGKGGVGKSTVTVNLAVAMAKAGLSVGVLDADLQGPSIPILFGLRRISPRVIKDDQQKELFIPITKFGVRSISIGYFIDESEAAMWRGPVLHSVLEKLIKQVEWGDLDLLLIDLPPGTGDVLISLQKLLPIDGAIIVTTPQLLAVADAIKAINSFDRLRISLVGIIENMAGFTVPGSTSSYSIFGQGKAQELARGCQVPFLGSIPLAIEIGRGSDEGYPCAFHQGENQVGIHFHQIAEQIMNSPYAKGADEKADRLNFN